MRTPYLDEFDVIDGQVLIPFDAVTHMLISLAGHPYLTSEGSRVIDTPSLLVYVVGREAPYIFPYDTDPVAIAQGIRARYLAWLDARAETGAPDA
jgi:hypothetical protein